MMKILLWLVVGALLLAGCRFKTATPAVTPTVLATTPPPATTTPTVTAAPSAVPSPAGTPLAAPTVLDRYPLAGEMTGESIASGAGRVWVGTSAGAVEQHSAADGSLQRSFTLAETAGDTLSPVRALAFDGQHLWAVVFSSPAGNPTTRLFVLDPASGATVQQFDVSQNDPGFLGLAPGQVWTQNQVYNTGSLQATSLPMQTVSTHFAYDGKGWVWAGGAVTCDSCASFIYRYQQDDPTRRAAGPTASIEVAGLALAGPRMWVVTHRGRLEAYDLTGASLAETTAPAASLDLSAEMKNPPTSILYDGHSLWLLSSTGPGSGYAYQHDPLNGQKLSALLVGDPDDSGAERARIPRALSFDGRDLWVLTSHDIVRVGLPWTR